MKPHKFEKDTPAAKALGSRVHGRKQVEVGQLNVDLQPRSVKGAGKKATKASAVKINRLILLAQTDSRLARMIAKAAKVSGEAPPGYVLRIMRKAYGSKLVKAPTIEKDPSGHPLIRMLEDTPKASMSLRQLVHANREK